jgi:hypothetical protein
MTSQAQELLLRDAMNFYVSITEVYGAEKGIEMFTDLCRNVCPELGQRVFFTMLRGQTRGRVTVSGLADPHDRVGCVREIRRLTGCGLKEAITKLDEIAQGRKVVLELQGGAEVSTYNFQQLGFIIA